MSPPRFTFTDRVAPILQIGVGDTRVDSSGGAWDRSYWDNQSPVLIVEHCNDFAAWVTAGGPPTVGAGQTGNGWILATSPATTVSYNLPAVAQRDTITVGFWIWSANYSPSQITMLELRSDAGATSHIQFKIDESFIGVYRTGGAALGSLVNTGANENVWRYIEIAVKLSDTVGQAIVRVDGVEKVRTAANQDTKNGGTKTVFDQVRFTNGHSGIYGAVSFDEIYVRNDLTFGATFTPVPAFWSGGEPTWVDVSCETFTLDTEYGRRRSTDRFVPGVATVLVRNLTGWADPHHVTDQASLSMRPGRALRAGVRHAVLGDRWLFRGIIDAVRPTYAPGALPTVQLDCIDALGDVGRAKVPVAEPAVGNGETADRRINRILDLASWPALKRDIHPSGWTLIASDMAAQTADLLTQAAESAGGVIFGNTDGAIAFRHREWANFDPTTPPDATIGNIGDGDVCPGTWERPFDRDDIATRVILGRDRETAAIVDDVAGQVLYGIEPFERVDLLTASDPGIISIAKQILAARSPETAPRVRSVTIDARNGDDHIDLMSSVSVFKPSRYRCRLRTLGRLVFDDQYLATGVRHEVEASRWTLQLNLDRAAPYAATGNYWDSAMWNQAWWADLNTELAALVSDLQGASP